MTITPKHYDFATHQPAYDLVNMVHSWLNRHIYYCSVLTRYWLSTIQGSTIYIYIWCFHHFHNQHLIPSLFGP